MKKYVQIDIVDFKKVHKQIITKASSRILLHWGHNSNLIHFLDDWSDFELTDVIETIEIIENGMSVKILGEEPNNRLSEYLTQFCELSKIANVLNKSEQPFKLIGIQCSMEAPSDEVTHLGEPETDKIQLVFESNNEAVA